MILKICRDLGRICTLSLLTRPAHGNRRLICVLGLILCMPIPALRAQADAPEHPILASFRAMPLDSAFAWMYRYEYLESDTLKPVGHELGLQTLRRAYRSQNDSIIAEAHSLLMDWHSSTKAFTFDSIVYHCEQSVAYALKTGNQRKVAQFSALLAYEYSNVLEYQKAQAAMFRALDIYEALDDAPGMARAYQSLSLFSISMGEPEQSIKYADQAMALFEKDDDYIAIAMTYLRYIKSYTMLGQYDKAYQVATDCIELIDTKVPPEARERGFSGRDIQGRAYSARGTVLIQTQDYAQALADFTRTWEMSVADYGEDISRGWRVEVGIACRHLGRYEEALAHLLSAEQLLHELNQTGSYLSTVYQEIAGCYVGLGQFEKALAYQEQAMAVKDALHAEQVATLKVETIAKYETGKKDQALVTQAAQITQQRQVQALTLTGAALLAALLLVLFYFFRKNKQVNLELNRKNEENELLLKEIHHRVKNNLQTISSLLSLQSESISDKSAYDAVLESKNRVTSMALLHQKLYQGENLAAIEMRDYFETIGKAIIDSFGERAAHVALEIDMPEMELDVDTAVPIGLITNELITNSLKHAFPGQQKGNILITLVQEADGLLRLNIADNGQAEPSEGTTQKEPGFGTLLVQLLTTQLGGKLEKSTQAGTSTIIQFPRQEKSVA